MVYFRFAFVGNSKASGLTASRWACCTGFAKLLSRYREPVANNKCEKGVGGVHSTLGLHGIFSGSPNIEKRDHDLDNLPY